MANKEKKVTEETTKAKAGWHVLLRELPFTPEGGPPQTLPAGRVVKLDQSDAEALGVQVRPATEDDISIGGSMNIDLTAAHRKAAAKEAE